MSEASNISNQSAQQRWLNNQWRAVPLLLWLIVAGWTTVFATYAILRFNRFNASLYDLAIKTQVIWNTANGRFFASSVEVEQYLGDHIQIIFLLLAPLYRLLPDVRLLLFVQAAILCLGAIPVYRLAQKRLPMPTAFAFAIAYLLTPIIGFVNRFDFHPLVFSAPLLLFALDAIDDLRLKELGWNGWRKRPFDMDKDKRSYPAAAGGALRLMDYAKPLLFILLAVSLREEVGLTIFALGLYVAIVWRMPRFGLGFGAAGLLWSLFAFFVLIPTFRGVGSDTLGRYAYLGNDPAAMLQTLFTRPFFVLQYLFNDGMRLTLLAKLLLPTSFLSLLAPAALFPALPALGYNLLADSPNQNSIYFQYLTPSLPFFFLAAINGTVRLKRWLPRTKTAFFIPTLLAIALLTAWLLDNPFTTKVGFPLFPVYGIAHSIDPTTYRAAAALIPPEASLATSMAYGPHQSNREKLYLFYDRGEFEKRPFGFEPADYLLLHLTDLRWDVNPRLFYANIETAIGHLGYEAIFFENDVLLLQKGAEPQSARTGAALARVIELTEAGGKFSPTSNALLTYQTNQWTVAELPETAVFLNQSFVNGVTLLGHETAIIPTAGAPLCTTLYFATPKPNSLPNDLTIFLHLTAPDGFVQAQRDSQPVLGFAPASLWQPNAILTSLHCLQIPPWLQPSDYRLLTGLYVAETGERIMLAARPNEQSGDTIKLTNLTLTLP